MEVLDYISRLRNRQIVAAQARELAALLKPENARFLASLDKYCRLSVYLPPPMKEDSCVLELGCGPGKYVALMHSLGYSVTGIDKFSFTEWEILQKSTSARLLDNVYAEELPFEDNEFDHVVCLGAFLYFDVPHRALGEVKRVLKPGGHFIVRNVNRENMYTLRTGQPIDPCSTNLYTEQELRALLKEYGFSVLDWYSYGYWPSRNPQLWWYVYCVYLPAWVQDWLSNRSQPEHRVNIIVNSILEKQ